ncbi:hypothetical protein BJY52DRAFT_1418141 [Lactarius psammicola]|nr:hypothetical protein BJY52DRAFT_1418141 [Lactarius psammicola]
MGEQGRAAARGAHPDGLSDRRVYRRRRVDRIPPRYDTMLGRCARHVRRVQRAGPPNGLGEIGVLLGILSWIAIFTELSNCLQNLHACELASPQVLKSGEWQRDGWSQTAAGLPAPASRPLCCNPLPLPQFRMSIAPGRLSGYCTEFRVFVADRANVDPRSFVDMNIPSSLKTRGDECGQTEITSKCPRHGGATYYLTIVHFASMTSDMGRFSLLIRRPRTGSGLFGSAAIGVPHIIHLRWRGMAWRGVSFGLKARVMNAQIKIKQTAEWDEIRGYSLHVILHTPSSSVNVPLTLRTSQDAKCRNFDALFVIKYFLMAARPCVKHPSRVLGPLLDPSLSRVEY